MTKPDFWTSMTAAQTIEPSDRLAAGWKPLVRHYEDWDPTVNSGNPVPKIIHQIWLGSPIPKLYANWGKTWKRCNPGWDYQLWTEREVDEFGLTNREAYEKAVNYGVKSDLARYEILARLGGVYADTDFECLASFDALASSTEFFTGLMYAPNPAIANGLIGARPGHPILTTLVHDLAKPFEGHDGMAIMAYSGPIKFSDVVIDAFNRGAEGVVLPTTYLYPFPNRDIASIDFRKARTWAGPESLAIHYWEVSWRTQSWTSKFYWWMRKHLPEGLVRSVYRLVKGKDPV